MPQAEPAERVVDRREPGPHPTAPLQLGLELGQRAVARTRCISLIAADGLTAKRRAAARIELPRSTARAILRRRSMEIGAGMATSRLVPTVIVESQALIPRNKNML
jgi:hypothetical protein